MKPLPLLVLLVGFCNIATCQADLKIAYRDGLYGYIDRSANWVIEPRFVEAGGWQGGAASVRLPGDYFAFIDTSGKYLMQPRRTAAAW